MKDEVFKETEVVVRDAKGRFGILRGFGALRSDHRAIRQVTASQLRPPVLEVEKVPEKVTASFYFDPQDEEEIERLKRGVSEMEPGVNFEGFVQHIIQESKIELKDAVLYKRLVSAITSRLRDIRTSIDLKELLTKPKNQGGVELTSEQADRVAELTVVKLKLLHEEDVRKKILLLPKEKKERSHEVPPAVIPSPPPFRSSSPTSLSPEKILAVRRPPVVDDRRPRMEDIKTPTRVLGPVEEIRNLSLLDFRRLSQMPKEAIEKVQEKVEILGEESYAERSKAIKAWRESEVYQLYLDLGNESMNKGKSVKEIIDARAVEGRVYLTEEEFHAVGDLNKSLNA